MLKVEIEQKQSQKHVIELSIDGANLGGYAFDDESDAKFWKSKVEAIYWHGVERGKATKQLGDLPFPSKFRFNESVYLLTNQKIDESHSVGCVVESTRFHRGTLREFGNSEWVEEVK